MHLTRGDLMTLAIFWSVMYSMPYWSTFPFQIWFYRSSRVCMLILIHDIGVEMMAWSLFYDDPSVEPLWGHSARPTIHLMPCWDIFPFWMRFVDLHGVAIPTCGVCTETMTFSLFYDDPSVEPRWSHSSKSAFLDIGLFSYFLLWETFPRCLDLIWITEITCPMIDDSVLPDFWLIVYLRPHWGIFPFRVRFGDLQRVTWSFPLMEYVPRRWFIRYCYDDSSVEPLGSHPVRHALLGT